MKRGQFLVEIMEKRGFNAMSLSKASGVPYTTIRSMIERDLTNASIDNVLKICRVLDIDAEALADPENWLSKEKNKSKESNELTDEEILTLAAHRVGYGGELTEEELKQIKKAIRIALEKE